VPKKAPTPETPWQAQGRILCGRPRNIDLGEKEIRFRAKYHDEAARAGDEEGVRTWRRALMDTRMKGADWRVVDDDGRVVQVPGWPGPVIAVLMDIRDALERIDKKLPARRRKTARAGGRRKAAR
jgi:hypothetical protein